MAFLGPLSKGNFRSKMTTIVGNRGQLWTSTISPHLLSPHLDFPKRSHKKKTSTEGDDAYRDPFPTALLSNNQHTGVGVYPYPLDEGGSARPDPKKGAPEAENPSCIGFTVLRGGLRPWSPWRRGRSKFAIIRGNCRGPQKRVGRSWMGFGEN